MREVGIAEHGVGRGDRAVGEIGFDGVGVVREDFGAVDPIVADALGDGKALLGQKVGDKVEIKLPSEKTVYKIAEIA